VTFDISNHLLTQVPLHDRLMRQAIQVWPAGETARAGDSNQLGKAAHMLHSRLLTEVAGFNRTDWLRQHRRARYHYLKPLLASNGLAQQPSSEMPGARGPVTATPGAAEPWGDMSPEQLYRRLCADLGLAAEIPL
jgi:hypothetical protein